MNEDDIENIYYKATGEWTGLDWAVSFRLPTDPSLEDLMIYSSDDVADLPEVIRAEAAEYCEQVRSDAAAAEDCAELAMGYYRDGNLKEALKAAYDAARIESAYGDSPTWGDLHDALQELWEKEMDDAAEGSSL